jgi:O-antigen/teichoic acid export membrane protein
LSLLLGLISFPILTRLLTTEEYGILGLVSTTMLLTVAVAKAGLSDGIVRFYKEYSDTPDRLTIFSSTVLLRGILLSIVTVIGYIVVFPIISKYLNINEKYLMPFMIMAIYLFVRPLNIIVLNILRINERTIFYNIINLIGKIISIVFSLFLLIYVIGDIYGYFIGVVIAEAVVALVLFYWFFSNYKITFSNVSGDLAKNLIKFGLPLLIAELSYLLLSYADRYMIVAYRGEGELGLYSVGYNLASYLSDMIMFSLSYAVIPIYVGIYEKEGREKTEEFLQRCMYYLLIAIIPMFFGYLAVSGDLFITLASKKYAAAAAFSPIILLGSLFLGMNNIFNAGLYLKKKSMSILLIMLSALIINIAINLIFIPAYGIMGAAIATLAACIALVALTVFLSYKYIIVRIDIRTIFYYLLLSGIMYLIVKQIETGTHWMNLIIKIIIGILIIIPCILIKEKEVRAKIKWILPIRFNKSKVF